MQQMTEANKRRAVIFFIIVLEREMANGLRWIEQMLVNMTETVNWSDMSAART